MWELISTSEQDGFEIRFYATPETMHPNDCFDDDGETAAAIHNGEYEWFVAKVTANKAGIELGADYLGACCYPHVTDFLEELYFEDMVAAAVAEARERIALLVEGEA